MAFFEAMQAIFSLNVVFFIDMIMNNLFWLFAFYVLIYFFFEGKNTVYWFVLWSFLLWAILDWEDLTGFVFTAGLFLMFYYLSKLAFLKFSESIPQLKDHLVLLSAIQAYSLIVIYTFLLK